MPDRDLVWGTRIDPHLTVAVEDSHNIVLIWNDSQEVEQIRHVLTNVGRLWDALELALAAVRERES